MKKEKFLENVVISMIIIFYGAFVLLSSLIKFYDFGLMFSLFFFLYGILHLIAFKLNSEKKEYSNLLIGITSILFGAGAILLKIIENPKYLAMFILLWAFLVSLIKLKKGDYFHDRKSKLWYIEISNLIIYLLSSILFSLNLALENHSLILLFGFFVFVIGILDFFEGLILNLTKGKLK